MNKFIVPEQDIDRLAIEETVRNDAVLVIPECVNSNILIKKANEMGFGDVFKCAYWSDLESIEESNVVFTYADYILQDIIKYDGSKAISMFMESDTK